MVFVAADGRLLKIDTHLMRQAREQLSGHPTAAAASGSVQD